MASRRMFSQRVTNSARFLKMPVDSQSLYFHLGMAADDDGVVEAWSVLRSTGSAEDNLKVLASKGFIKVLNEDLVSYVLDWNEHNALRADRITPSQYRSLLVQVLPDVQLTEPKERADRPLRLGRPMDNQGTAQDRLGKDRLNTSVADAPQFVEVSESEESPKRKSAAKYPNAPKVFGLWGSYPQNWKINTAQLRAAENLFKERGLEEVENALKWYKDLKEKEFCPQVDTPYDLDSKWLKLETFIEKQ